jgi:hypothetical protein
MALKYMRDCEICNVGVIKRGEELIDDGFTLNKACHIISDEIAEEYGTRLFSAGSVRGRILLHTGKRDPHPKKKVVHSEQHSEPESEPKDEDNIYKAFERLEETFEDFKQSQSEFWEEARTLTPKLELSKEGQELFTEFIKAGLHVMAKKHHPDKGGTTEAMTIINNINEYLLTIVS